MHTHTCDSQVRINQQGSLRSDSFVELLERLLAVPAASSFEHPVAQIVREEIKRIGYEAQSDASGNVHVLIPGSDDTLAPIVFAAHMDEISAYVQGIESDGSLRIDSFNVAARKIGEGPVEIVGDHATIAGVISFGSGHAAAAVGAVSEDKPGLKAARVLTGLTCETLDKAGVRAGSPLTPPAWRRGPLLLGDAANPLLAAWTFDDRAGVVMLLQLLGELRKMNFKPVRTTCIGFTIHEEAGGQGAKLLAQQIKPEIFIGVDGTPILPDTDLKLQGGPCVWAKDRLATCDPRLVKAIIQVAKDNDLPIQPVFLNAAYGDSTSVFSTGLAPRVTTVGHVRASSHGFEVAYQSCFTQTLTLLMQLVQTSL